MVLLVLTGLTLFFASMAKELLKPVFKKARIEVIVHANQSNDTAALHFNLGNGDKRIMPLAYGMHDHEQDTLIFRLPLANINKLKIIPAQRSDTVIIKKIKMVIGDQRYLWTGEDIFNDFTVTEPIIDDSTGNLILLRSPDNAKPVSLQLSEPLHQRFILVEDKKPLIGKLLAFYVLATCMVAFWGKRMAGWLLNTGKRIFKNTLSWLSLWDKKLLAGILIVMAFRYFLGSAQQMNPIPGWRFDEGLYVSQAFSIMKGNWLGDYNMATLIKSFVYPVYLAAVNFTGLSLFTADLLMTCMAAMLTLVAFRPLFKGSVWQLLLFASILMNPATFQSDALRVIRDTLFANLSVILFASMTGALLRIQYGNRILFRWMAIAGISFFLAWNTREEGEVYLPVMLLFTIVLFLCSRGWLPAITGYINPGLNKNSSMKTAGLLILPYLVLIVGNLAVATVNKVKYGLFIRTEAKAGFFNNSYSALSSIDNTVDRIDIPVPKEARMLAYEVSPTFAKLREYLEDTTHPSLRKFKDIPDDFTGTWFMWAYRTAAEKAGFHKSLHEAEIYYNNITHEINKAFGNGKLKKKKLISFYYFLVDPRIITESLKKGTMVMAIMVRYTHFSPYPSPKNQNLTGIARFQNITHEPACISLNQNTFTPEASRLKYFLIITIAGIYKLVNPYLAAISLMGYVLLTVTVIRRKQYPLNLLLWMILTAFLTLVVTRVMLVSYIAVSQWDPYYMQYLYPGYHFMMIFELLSLCYFYQFLKLRFSQ